MKGLILLFLAIAIGGIAWGYADKPSRKGVSAFIKKNLLPIILAVVAVAVAIFVSTNTTLRLV